MTEKLYYRNAYIKEFRANVLSVSRTDTGYDVILDRTAFFPEEGGQSADRGRISDAQVLDVQEEDGVIHHLTDKAPVLGEAECEIDFDERFEKMQLHTAEHIICGMIHKLFGYDNVGFHLGTEEVTFDVNGIITREELDRVESLANEVVFSNVAIETLFPTPDELSNMKYRAKLDTLEGIRIVKIGDYDTCACCAPHVAYTGEVGLIKILDFMKHRGGTRVWMTAGRRAVADYRAKYENIKKISALTSAPQHDTAEILEAYMHESESIKSALKAARIKIAELEAERIDVTEKNAVFYLPDFTTPELIAFSNVAKAKVGGITVALSGNESDFKYVISSENCELTKKIKEINKALSGRGGGKPNMMQGSFGASLAEIRKYFE